MRSSQGSRVKANRQDSKKSAESKSQKLKGDLLFEIGCEEIPAGMILKASQELNVLLSKQLLVTGLINNTSSEDSIETFGAPRRLIAIARNIYLKQPDVIREVVGPPKSIAYDNVGVPTRAAISFAEKQGLTVAQLSLVSTPKGEYVVAKQTVIGQPAPTILAGILSEVIRGISWQRSMYWAASDSPRFIRPIRWLVAVLDGKVIRFSFGDVQSGNHTSGHRFLGRSVIPVNDPADFESKLKRNFVLCKPKDRRTKIEAEIRALTSRKGLHTHADPALLELITYLNEYPTVICGDFDSSFLALPEEILITVMRGHQKYFALEDRRNELAPHFLAVINLAKDSKGLVKAGHERVLRARFADAQFFWETDQKVPLGSCLPKLYSVTYERRLGNYGAKVERMRSIARWLAEQWFSRGLTKADVAASDRAAELAKCDLVTEMVREFTELQGVVGGLYARAQGEPEEIAWAVYDQYKPVGLDDPIPRNLTGCTVALADKLDSLVACFAVGAIPTGSSDPFALRRAALGVVKIILECKLPLSLSAAISASAKSLKEHAPNIEVPDGVQLQVLDFLLERARYILRAKHGYASDEIAAAFAAGADDLIDAVERVSAVKALRDTKNFPALASAFKRIRNILQKSAEKSDMLQLEVQPGLLHETAELQLHTVAQRIGEEAGRRKREKKYRAALEKIAELRPAVDHFFDKVLVMSEDENIRRNRLALLGSLLKEFSTIADFSQLSVEESGRELK